MQRFDRTSIIMLAVVLVSLVSAMVFASRAATFVGCSPELVRIGVAPFWRSRLERRDIVDVATAQVDVYADYGGWDIKGSARSPRGRLFSTGGRAAVWIVMRVGRKYLLTFREPAVPVRVRVALLGND
ncbi:hypothetical protein [Curtobacterium sp. ZW137]|uniref:hypothetical protein n=1 Tax=Curtobacterium sp. ZW137 TaxID=2485104 RepID=UPI000F4CED28|nr:hypothetical protein [Curtobacterium sp. ZW137]